MKVYVEDILAAPIASASVTDTKTTRRSVLNNKKLSTRKRLTQATLVFSDIVALCTVINILIISSMVLGLQLPAVSAVIYAFSLFPLAYMSFGLYRPVLIRPEREILSLCKANLAVIAGLSVPVLFVPQFRVHMVLWLGIAGPLLILIVPFFRVLARIMYARANWWGQAAFVIGNGQEGLEALTTLQRAPELGLKAAAILQDDLQLTHRIGVPAFSSLKLYHSLAKTHQIDNVVVALDPDEEASFLQGHAERPVFKNIYVTRRSEEGQLYIKGLTGNKAAGFNLAGNSFWFMTQAVLKRTADFIGAFVGLILLAPLFASIILLNKLTSRGPVFFMQERMGKDGRLFNVYKFRTMHVDAEAKLQQILDTDPVRRQEYEIFHKLRDDPRITPIGRVLRRYSLDEFPQLINVLVGEMSLVGPRAYLPRELPKMRGLEKEVLKSAPGLTGLWQVSGRNQLSFDERVTIDVDYQKSSSLSLDYYILLKTIPVVLTGNGAG
ncbi:MAG: exopolysaccharide biosynthesis polyprenyl glycosylphosphotransferase [Bacteroidota bacterium]